MSETWAPPGGWDTTPTGSAVQYAAFGIGYMITGPRRPEVSHHGLACSFDTEGLDPHVDCNGMTYCTSLDEPTECDCRCHDRAHLEGK